MRQVSLMFSGALIAFSLFTIPGCGGGSWSYNVVGTDRNPGAEGTIQVERIEGGNHMVTVSLTHLTPPERLGGNLTTYVMWFRNDQGRSRIASPMDYEPDSRTARATATNPDPVFSVLITAEPNAEVSEPSENVMFRQRVSTSN